ncbi:MAG TPA: protein kinase [Myxococcales bacterium]
MNLICHLCGSRPAPDSTFGTRCPKDGSALVQEEDHKKAPKDSILGRVIGGKYPVVGLIGQGGMGAVYKALQEPVGREVALKVIRNFGDETNESVSETLRMRFFREAKVVAKLANPAAVTLYDYGAEDDGVLYMVLEFVKGRRVSDAIRDDGPLTPGRARDICCQVLNALAEAHALGLVHRDLKPDNIMLVKGPWGEEQAKVLDFGIAKVRTKEKETLETGTGLLLGTPLYMPPEQAMARGAEPRSDLYSLGVVLYEMLAGVPPFTAGTVFEVLLAHREKPVPDFPPDFGVPPALEEVVKRAMAKEPEDRFADAEEMAQALVDAVPMGSDPPSSPGSPTRIPSSSQMGSVRTPLPVALRQSNSLLNASTQSPSTRTPLPPAVRRSGPGLLDPNAAAQKSAQKVSAAGVRKSHAEVHHSQNGASVSVRAPLSTPEATQEDLAGTALRATPRPIADAMPPRPQTPRPVTVLPAAAEIAMTAAPAAGPSPAIQVNPQWQREDKAAVHKSPGLKIALAILGMLVIGGSAGGTLWYLNSRSQAAAVKGLSDIPAVPDPVVAKPELPAKLPDTPAKPADPVPDKPAVADVPPVKPENPPAVAETGPDASVPPVAVVPTPDPKPNPNATPDPKADPKPAKTDPKVAKPKILDPVRPKVVKPKTKDPGMRQVEEGGYKTTVF